MKKTRTIVSYAKEPAAILMRAAKPEVSALLNLVTRRYPDAEWASFVRCGWRETPQGLVLTLAQVDGPLPGDMDENVGHVGIFEPYTLRTALSAERHDLAVGVVHSHPEGCRTSPSWIDDDMDGYFAEFFSGFAPGRPYVSLIFAHDASGRISGTGRVFWKGQWHRVGRFALEGCHITLSDYRPAPSRRTGALRARTARLESAFGEEAADRLDRSTIAVIGAGGTGSPVIEALARAGVGHLIVVDPDRFAASNYERVHGSEIRDIEKRTVKVEIARRHIKRINPRCRITAIQGALPQAEVLDAVVWADVVIGCTDQEHS
ncbi:MAG: ThiF family adenylyltransferase, partial [Acidobacteriota bacterium]|nr:ThiF family adenylyltransferase [Acidobacteriota bacterium]